MKKLPASSISGQIPFSLDTKHGKRHLPTGIILDDDDKAYGDSLVVVHAKKCKVD